MDVFYNVKGIGDVLIIPVERGNQYDIHHEKFGDITKITDGEGNVLGYNIFRAATHLNIAESGKIALNEELLNKLQQLFKAEGLSDSLEFDLSPKFVVGYVTDKSPHENADKLSVCQVDVGNETLQIVCGAANVDKGQKVVVAKIGATMPSGLKIKPTELRGVPSNGMICSRKELGLPVKEDEKGIYILEESYEVGTEFEF